MRIVLTGGGTGGHVYPAISIGQALKESVPDVELLYVGSSHGPEGDIARQAGMNFVAISSSSLSRALSFRNAVSLCRLIAGVFSARKVLNRFRPDLVIGTGGYVSAAILLAQWTRRGRIIIHEQNALPGRTNLALAKIAKKICVTFDSSAAYLTKDKVVVTGLPIRREFQNLPDKAQARRELGLKENLFTVVVVGGSQGAKKVNEVVTEAWAHLDDGQTQMLHQVGPRNIADAQERPRYHVEAYIDVPLAFAAADLVISRSGASSVCEMTAAGLPSILFPYPHAYADHQMANARHLVDNGAAVLCEDLHTTPEMLAGILSELRSSPERLNAMASASAALGKPDAAARVAEVALSVAGAK